MKCYTIDGCDEAIVGQLDDPLRAVYLFEKLVDVFMEQGMDYDGAVEWIDFNIIGTAQAYLGPGAPVIMFACDRDRLDELADNQDDDEEIDDG